jgi:hypothetical protein
MPGQGVCFQCRRSFPDLYSSGLQKDPTPIGCGMTQGAALPRVRRVYRHTFRLYTLFIKN